MTNTIDDNNFYQSSPLRTLSDHEKFFQIGQVTVLYAIAGIGTIDENALYSAITALQEEYPLLGMVITTSPGAIDSLPEFQLVPSMDALSHGPLFHKYSHTFQPDQYPILETLISTQRLFAIELYQATPEDYTVVVYIRHIVSDAKNGIALLHKLWELYTEKISQGSISPRPVLAIPQNNENVLTQRNHAQLPPFNLSSIFDSQSIHTAPNITGTSQLLNPPVRLLFSEEFSAQLKNAGKSQGLTINSLISAALIMAEFDLLKHEKRTISEFLLNTEVDLRPHVPPKVGELEITNFLGNSFYLAQRDTLYPYEGTTARTAAFVHYAHEVKQKILQDLSDKQVYSYSRFTPEILELITKMFQEWKTPLSHTNWGIVAEFAAPPEITHKDFRGWNLIAPDTIMEDPFGRIAVLLYNAMVFSSTFQNRISIDIVQAGPFFPVGSAEFIAQAMRDILQEWVSTTE